MFNALFAIFKHIIPMNTTTSALEDIISILESQYVKDGNAKDAAIDAIIQILEAHKTTAVIAPIPPKQ
jgi:hypothetical protein